MRKSPSKAMSASKDCKDKFLNKETEVGIAVDINSDSDDENEDKICKSSKDHKSSGLKRIAK